MLRDSYGLAMLRHPSRNSLPERQLQPTDFLAMWILRGAQNQIIAFTDVDEAGIAANDSGSKFNDSFQILVQRVFRGEAAAYVMKKINVIIEKRIGTHDLT